MGWLGRSLGQFGENIGDASQIVMAMRRAQQEYAAEQARQKIESLMAPLRLQQLQNEVSQFGQPKPEGIISTPGGGQSGVTFTPGKGYATQGLTLGIGKDSVKQRIQQMAATAPTQEDRDALNYYAASLDLGEDPAKVLEKAESLYATMAQKATPKAVTVKTTTGTGIPYEIVDEKGKSWNVDDPNLPDNLKSELSSYSKAHKAGLEQQAAIQAQKDVEALNRAIKIGDMREAQKARDGLLKLANRGIAGHSFLTTVQKQVEAARNGGGQGTTSGDLLIVEGFMQTMFGVDPKALRGSPKMMEMLLKQGGWDDRAIAEMNSIRTGGKLSQDVREQILQNTQTQIQSWDQAVTQSAALVDDPKTKQILDRYLQVTSAGTPTAPNKQPGPKANDLSDLGGTPHVN